MTQRCAQCGHEELFHVTGTGGPYCAQCDCPEDEHAYAVPAPSPEEPVEAGEHVDLGWERSKFRCSCGEQFATQQEMTAHTPIQLRIRSAKPPSPEGDQLCKTCGQSEKMWQHEGCPLPTCSMHHPFEPTGAGQAEAPAPAVESEGEARRWWHEMVQWAGALEDGSDAMEYMSDLAQFEAAIRAQAPTWEQVFEAIAHGDDDHRGWLREACENLWAGLPVPEPRGKNTTADLFEQLAAVTAERDRLDGWAAKVLDIWDNGKTHEVTLETLFEELRALRPPSTESKEAE